MVTAEQLVIKFFEKAQINKPTMSPHQLHAYVIGLLADELAWAFNNDDTVARNVRRLLHKLDTKRTNKLQTSHTQVAPLNNSQSAKVQSSFERINLITSSSLTPKNSKIGSDISKTLSYESLILFLKKFPKTFVKDLRDEKNGFIWIFVAAKAYDDDSQLFQWLKKNKFQFSEIENAWYYPIL